VTCSISVLKKEKEKEKKNRLHSWCFYLYVPCICKSVGEMGLTLSTAGLRIWKLKLQQIKRINILWNNWLKSGLVVKNLFTAVLLKVFLSDKKSNIPVIMQKKDRC